MTQNVNGTSEKKILRKKLAASSDNVQKDQVINYLKKNVSELQQQVQQQNAMSSLLVSTHQQMEQLKQYHNQQVSSLKSQIQHNNSTNATIYSGLQKSVGELGTHVEQQNYNLDAKVNSHMQAMKEQYDKKLQDNVQFLSAKFDAINNMHNNSIDLLKAGIDRRAGASQQHANELEILKKELESIKASLGSYAQNADLNALSNQVNSIGSSLNSCAQSATVDAAKKELETLKASLGSYAQNADLNVVTQQIDKLGSSLNSCAQSAELDIAKKKIAELQSTLESRTSSMSSLKKEIENIKKKIAAMPVSDGYLLIGDHFNLPEQPNAAVEGGVHKNAPLSMAVNGGLVLHDIGYTTKKGLQLTLDPETQRLLVYHGK